MRPLTRGAFVRAAGGAAAALALPGCRGGARETAAALPDLTGWRMPAEEARHAATWMCFPSSDAIWGADLAAVQRALVGIARAIAPYEPVRMLVRPAARRAAAALAGADVELVDGPVDDLWARDTLPLMLTRRDGAAGLAASHAHFNGWGGKQAHAGDARLAEHVARLLDVPLLDGGVTGEGGGVETDGAGTLLAARSSWVNANRNPGRSADEIADALTSMLGADRLLWLDGIAGHDITDGHVDTLARFADPGTIVHEDPGYVEPGETWYEVASATARTLGSLRRADGAPYRLVRLTQPTTTAAQTDAFLPSYLNYYTCNGAVIAPRFGDEGADAAAADVLQELYPDRDVVQIAIDPIAEGGGGIHCATQQQPAAT